jgi:UDP:flavonoid glycosyltransferase YjiC (YdhE family)
MRLILATTGTLGDHVPMIGLGCALQRQGYKVQLACNPAMHELARRCSLEVIPFGDAVGPGDGVGSGRIASSPASVACSR